MADPSSSDGSLTLSALFSRALESASKAYNLPSIENETQDILKSSIKDVSTVIKRVEALSLFSDNETLEDVSTKDLVYMFAPWVNGELINRVKTDGPDERIQSIQKAQGMYGRFLKILEDYEIVPQEERKIFMKSEEVVRDPVKRRETKIQQFKKEKEIRAKVLAFRERRGHGSTDSPTDYDLIASLLPKTQPKGRQQAFDEDDKDEDDEITRELTLLLLRLIWTQALSQVDSMKDELELLKSAPHRPPQRGPPPPHPNRDDTWRLDQIGSSSGLNHSGPLLDDQGRPLRPFTILPAGAASERARLQAGVFRPDHRLPTMSIDEYLEVERQRGNIISGGGPASQTAPTSSEQLLIDSEQDGAIFAEEKHEEKRRKDEEWALFTEANPKGSGNTMNRG
ncbi:hypothetical protein FRB99_004430 [Tulasnella sp. 403]|nr:hypothetical protein FRB99_004430 [Tulasnella sp. 403]